MARSLRALSLLVLGLALARSAGAVAPTVTITSPTAGSLVSRTKLIEGTFTGRDDPNSATEDFTVTVNGEEASLLSGDRFQVVVELPVGLTTVKAVATDNEGTDTKEIAVTGDERPVITITAPLDDFSTGDATVTVSGNVDDDNLDPNNPNTLTANGTRIPLDANGDFSQVKLFLGVGDNTLQFRALDLVNNIVTKSVSVTRTRVCENPTLPEFSNGDPNEPHFIVVDRFDDRVLPAGFNPNVSPFVACDIRPDRDSSNSVVPPVGRCTLRGAIQLANEHDGPDVIQLPTGTIKLTRRGDDIDRGDLDVTEDLLILGRGRDVSTIDARKLRDRIFDVAPGVSFTISDTTLRGGQTPKKSSESGGCLRVTGPRNAAPDPNTPSLVANNLALLDCKSGAEGGGIALELQGPNDFSKVTCGIVAHSSAKKDGGGILVDGGALELRNSTIAFTSSGGIGGALANRGSLVMTNSTISGNKAKVSGGGLALASGASATLNNVTFAKNKAKRGASVSTSGDSGEFEVSNSILGDKPKATCDLSGTPEIVSNGGNLDPGETCGLDPNDPKDLVKTNPRLEKLATNTGTPTHALRFDSPAIDHGVFATCEPLDERTADRVDGPPTDDPGPNDDVCDSGAFEFASEAPPAPPAK